MKGKGEEINENIIYRDIERPNNFIVEENDKEGKYFEDINEYTYYQGYLYNGTCITTTKDKKVEMKFRFGLKHGLTKIHNYIDNVIEERTYFNDKFISKKERKSDLISNERKDDIIKTFNDYSDTEKRNIQISAFIKCVYELISIDGKITEEEQNKFMNFVEEIKTEFSDDLNADSEEHKFVVGGRENIINAIKGFSDNELNFFFDTLISFALVDGELALEEANMIAEIAAEIYPDLDSNEKLHDWMVQKIKESNSGD